MKFKTTFQFSVIGKCLANACLSAKVRSDSLLAKSHYSCAGLVCSLSLHCYTVTQMYKLVPDI